MKKLLAILCSLVLLLTGIVAFSACGGDGETIKVGVTLYDPMDYKDENGEWVGFDAELAEKAFGELGYNVEFVEIVWETKIVSLNAKEIDCIWNGMTVTDELKEAILLTDPYLVNQQVVVVRSADKDKYKTTADLANAQSIAFEGGSAAESVLGDLNIDESKLLSQEKQLDTFLEVKTGSSDIAVVDKTLAQSICGTGDYKDLTFVDVGFAEEEFAVGFRKSDSELCSQIDDLLAKYATDGTIAGLKEKYGIN